MLFRNESIISINDIDRDKILYLLEVSKDVKDGKYKDFLQNKVFASLFFEPSTRTRLSFESAIQYQGGKIIGFSSSASSSVKKGESLVDTIQTVNGYCDAIIIRHNMDGASRLAAEVASVPIINAGDGANQHPTQTFLDLFTILEKKKTLDGLNIGLMGDLKYGRTVHSLTTAFSHFNSKLFFIAPKELAIPNDYLNVLKNNQIEFEIHNDVSKCDSKLDILYCTRIQRERFFDPYEYDKVASSYKIDLETLSNMKKDAYIMHPLPRVDEISTEIDKDSRAIYFEQAHNGVFVRQALLGLILGTIIPNK